MTPEFENVECEVISLARHIIYYLTFTRRSTFDVHSTFVFYSTFDIPSTYPRHLRDTKSHCRHIPSAASSAAVLGKI
jgi:hypothetical protein